MIPAPHQDEQKRLEALRSYAILDTPREADFDDVVKILAEVCDVPFSTITLIDENRQWHKAAFGLGDLRETPRDVAFCGHTILHDGDMLVVPDVTQDPRFADNPFVTGDPCLRFYAGAVLRTETGLPLGTVCVVDYKPRELDARQKNILQLMAKHVMAQITLRREVMERRIAEKRLQLLNAELHHRVKNTLATVQAVIQMSLRSARDMDSFRDSIGDRIASLANTHTMLSTQNWGAVSFRELVGSELAPYRDVGRITLDGPDVDVASQAAVTIGMVIHELMTNACKYGALSTEAGTLGIVWTAVRGVADTTIDLWWTERGGPPAPSSIVHGFGTTLLRRLVAGQLAGSVEFLPQPEGLRVHVTAKLAAPPLAT